MESYVQITNEAAAKTILRGAISELYCKREGCIVPCERLETNLFMLEKGCFFVKLTSAEEDE
ncbi:hypothetical protein DOE69_01755 [Listeria monocytogenes]|uniref:hypothetical protein n=1 Tax=Listeria welshimeri TaxID=1643 RepID=UPI000EBECCBD|nr:hypothetical protein [Listeria welshimeri]EAD7934030.1 hypothetical protein [Listeria monocytogenes]EAE1772510.1 hypothetical protein [Listeria monocytogenes]EAG9437505.1 hypothetical protein [Listeria monocytogenes]EHB3621099.1 hypothetical protein [Listeria monocytogenes]EHM4866109.1 hypothetical protein [Listeria monocytogenes]